MKLSQEGSANPLTSLDFRTHQTPKWGDLKLASVAQPFPVAQLVTANEASECEPSRAIHRGTQERSMPSFSAVLVGSLYSPCGTEMTLDCICVLCA